MSCYSGTRQHSSESWPQLLGSRIRKERSAASGLRSQARAASTGDFVGVALDLEVASAQCEQIISRLSLGLLDGDLGAALAGVGQVLAAAVDDGANPFQELDPGIGEVFPQLGRHTEGFLKLLHKFAAQAALLNKRLGRILLS